MSYINRLLAAVDNGALDFADIGLAEVRHDRWCGVYKDTDCNCDPEIFITTKDGRIEVLHDGTVRRIEGGQ